MVENNILTLKCMKNLLKKENGVREKEREIEIERKSSIKRNKERMNK